MIENCEMACSYVCMNTKIYIFHIYMKNIIFFLQENFEDYLQTGAFFASILSSTSLNDLYVVFKI